MIELGSFKNFTKALETDLGSQYIGWYFSILYISKVLEVAQGRISMRYNYLKKHETKLTNHRENTMHNFISIKETRNLEFYLQECLHANKAQECNESMSKQGFELRLFKYLTKVLQTEAMRQYIDLYFSTL